MSEPAPPPPPPSWLCGVELGGGVEVVHGPEREAAEGAEEAAGVERHSVAEHEVAELVLEARHGELHRDPRAAGDGGGGGGEVVDGADRKSVV